MKTKIEFIYGDRKIGKTKDLLQSLSTVDNVGIIVRNSIARNEFKNLVVREFLINRRIDDITKHPNKINNITFIVKQNELYGNHFDRVYIDDADELDWKYWLHNLRDSMSDKGGKISLYFNSPVNTDNFSVRLLNVGDK